MILMNSYSFPSPKGDKHETTFGGANNLVQHPLWGQGGLLGVNERPTALQPRSGLNSFGVRDGVGYSPTPSCASLARGYHYISPSEIGVQHIYFRHLEIQNYVLYFQQHL